MNVPLETRTVPSSRARLLAGLGYLVVGVLMFIPMPSGEGEPLIPHLDKLVHLGCWALLGFATFFALTRVRVLVPRLLAAVGLASAFGVLVELGQGLTSTRSADPWDALADTIGALLGATTAAWVAKNLHPRSTGDRA